KAHNPYSLDLVLRDLQNSRIQVYIKKDCHFSSTFVQRREVLLHCKLRHC
nr:hypothetical protein [Tanacetum cinerariifolium]